jgi:hypothetical protein
MGICGSLGAYMFYGLFASVSWATVWDIEMGKGVLWRYKKRC